MNRNNHSILRTAMRLVHSSVHSVSSVVKSSAHPSDSGSALILVLLITALLATIAVSFLSTSRVEQIAAKNFTRQNAAASLAELATGKAMAQIQKGFTTSSNGTVVITTQPGAIRQFVFSGGNITTNSTTTELFSGTGNATTNGTANLNNLQNPFSSSNATTNQFTITGNRLEQINVPMENISSNGTIVGRIAYYVDDEGTKLNVNNAIGNRTTLNAAARPQDIGALLNATTATSFSEIINNSATTNSTTNWNYFFRPEQVQSAVSGFSSSDLPFLTTTTTSANSTANMTHLLTPWGTQRLYINELPITSTGVNRTFTALTGISSNGSTADDLANGRALQNIFSGNFSTKYTDIGVKQIAANMLQMRDPNTFSINASGNYTGPLLGADNLDSNGIPQEYLGYAPYPVISEVGMSGMLTAYFTYNSSAASPKPLTAIALYIHLQPIIEIYNPYPYDFNIPPNSFPRILLKLSKVSYTMNWTWNGTNYSGNFVTGSAPPPNWPNNIWPNLQFNPQLNDGLIYFDTFSKGNGNSTTINKNTKFQTRIFYANLGLRVGTNINLNQNGNVQINSLSNVKVQFEYIKLLANSGNSTTDVSSGYTDTIRDWVTSSEIGELDVELKNQPFPCVITGPTTNSDNNWVVAGWGVPNTPPLAGEAAPIPTKSAQRISHLVKIPLASPAITIDDINRNWTTTNSSISSTWLSNSTNWVNSSSSNFGFLGSSNSTSTDTSLASPSASANFTIRSDPSYGDSVANAIYANPSLSNDMREPYLLTGNYTCPADLGFVPTNRRWRRLRMQMQPSAEGSLIPDWAMLGVISFGNSTDANNAFNRMHPVNINGRFHLPGNATISPRTIGLRAVAKVLENSSADIIQDTMNPATTSNSTAATRFRGNTANATTIANAIGNMTWSNNSAWGNSTSNSTSYRRNALKFPANQYILPSEIMEIAGVADAVDQTDYANSTSHFKWNEGRASALIPAVTTRSSFFMIYAYAQALDKNQVVESEALTKTLVEVVVTPPTSSNGTATYSVKKLYTQPIPLGQ